MRQPLLFSSGGSVALRLRRIASPRRGMPYYQKPILAALVTIFLFSFLYKNKFLTALKIKNPVRLWRTGFLVVAGAGLEPATFGL